MRLYALHASAHNWHADVNFFQTAMFHGEAVLPPNRAGVASHELGEAKMAPMEVIINGFNLASIFRPIRCSNLVVSSIVARSMPSNPSRYKLLPIVFKKVYYLPWDTSAASQLPQGVIDLINNGKEMEISGLFCDTATTIPIQDYFEIVAPNHYKLLGTHPPTHEFFTKNYTGKVLDLDLVPVSEKLYSDYPITSAGYPIIGEPLFEILQPFINSRYFGIKEFDF